MNLAVHGAEGDIRKAITYSEDPHEPAGKADFVMTHPPFNVDEEWRCRTEMPLRTEKETCRYWM